MRTHLRYIAVLSAVMVSAGCTAALRPLMIAEPPASVKRVEPLDEKIPLPVDVVIKAPESMPIVGGKYTYSLKHVLEKSFKNAAGAIFDGAGGTGEYSYRLEVTARSSQLQALGLAKDQAEFSAVIVSKLINPDDKVLENKTYSGRKQSSFDKANTPDAVWEVCYTAAGELADSIRQARWLRKARTQVYGAAPTSAAQMQAMINAAAKSAAANQPAAKKKERVYKSDIDNPTYKSAERPDDFALVIGITQYSSIPEASFAERDAEAMKKHLIAQGFPERNVVHLVGSKATRTGIKKYLEEWLPRNVTDKSRVFFYFSGHGAPDTDSKEAFMVPWDGDPNFLKSTAYSMNDLYARLSELKAKEVVVALDACFSGSGGRSVLAKGARPLVMNVDTGKILDDKLTVFAAAGDTQITSALDDQGHGIFSYYFMKGLAGDAKDSSGKVTAQGLFDYLQPKVADAARRQNREQTPALRGGDKGRVLGSFK
ncbi:MAG: caspase family protein [Elusimicrobiota bacterium]